MIDRTALSLLALLIFCPGCDTAPQTTDHATDCTTVSVPPDSLGLSAFYDKYCPAAGIPVVSAGEVSDDAVMAAGDIVTNMLREMPEARQVLAQSNVRVGVIGADQETTDMPAYSDLNEEYPDVDWDERSRGLAATPARPLTSAAEENLMCYADDPYAGESILVHEFGHTIKGMGLETVDDSFAAQVDSLYQSALDAGRWADTYAASNADEYWAEGVQSYFNANREASPPNGVHNHVDTRPELAEYDPPLFAVLDSTFGGLEWSPSCP